MKKMKYIVTTVLLLLSVSLFSQENSKANFDKREVYIEMRDGTKLFTAIYTPKDISKDNK